MSISLDKPDSVAGQRRQTLISIGFFDLDNSLAGIHGVMRGGGELTTASDAGEPAPRGTTNKTKNLATRLQL